MDEREVYPNAPVVLVALEVRHPSADPLTPTESRTIKKILGDLLPIERSGQLTNVQVVAGATAPADVSIETFPRYVNRETTLAVSVRKEAMVIEASRYPGWEEFRTLSMRALEARMQVAPVVGVERVGLRFINEIRVPNAGTVDWSDWLHPSLLGPSSARPIDLPVNQWQGVVIYGAQPSNMLVLRYGLRDGYALDPSSLLRRVRSDDDGLFFLMDLDSFWTPAEEVPEYDSDKLLSICNALHTPVRTLFEGMITDRLRDEVLRRDD
ncbi:MAG TPA: TIGR04255 family protein [Actinophytocola sp.]|jgi:uncharacterized protein (TIGR04255 family)|uniref:TIGR04255 family protein n=1 Tax=Actinophytocola sp. TaxID=1872138 RepID=UPI002DF87598|nr:TIGR04255 family protein [Actinophytocola sp.]